jgi:predicted dehydrogenase
MVEASFSYVLEDLANIRLRADRQGGALTDVGCYGIDLARFIFREEPMGVTARCVRGERSGVDELVAITLLFSSGSAAVVTASTHLARYHAYRVRGTRGIVTVPNAFVPGDEEPTQILIECTGGERRVEDFPPFAAFVAEVAHFTRAARVNDPTLLPPMEDGIANARILEAAISSMSEGQRVSITWTQ